MYTHCPHCRTTFRIYSDQLARARGQVRCGVCNNHFNALESLTDNQAPLPIFTAREEEVEEHTERIEPSERQTADTAIAAEALSEMAQTHEIIKPDIESAPLAKALADAEETIAVPPAQESIVIRYAAAAATRDFAADIPAVADHPTPSAVQPTAVKTEDESIISRPNQPDMPLPDLGIIAAEPRPIPATATSSPHWFKTTLWAMLNIVLILALAGQYAYANRDDLIQYPVLRPWLSQLCMIMACEAPLRSDASRIVLANRLVESDPNHSNALLIDATLVNNADFPQPYPLLEIRFSDLNGQLVAGRRFRPSEYLSPGTPLQAGMAPHQPVHAALQILDPGKNAVSFQFDML
jgi:predicted Zn finger-like uncharacterized protein